MKLNKKQKEDLFEFYQVCLSSAVLIKYKLVSDDAVFKSIITSTLEVHQQSSTFSKEDSEKFCYVSIPLVFTAMTKIPEHYKILVQKHSLTELIDEDLIVNYGNKTINDMQSLYDSIQKMELQKELVEFVNEIKQNIMPAVTMLDLINFMDMSEKQVGDKCKIAHERFTNYLISESTLKPLCDSFDTTLPNKKYAELQCIVISSDEKEATFKCGGKGCEKDHIANMKIYFPYSKELFYIDGDMLTLWKDE